MNRIRKGDQVVVITGKYKGQKGEVLRVDGDKRRRLRTSIWSSATPSRIRRPTSRAASSSARRRSIFPT
jgi:transcription antitermination factor NusG